MVLGVVISLRVWWIPLIYMLLFALYYERIIFAEDSQAQVWKRICRMGVQDASFSTTNQSVENTYIALLLEKGAAS